MALEKIPRSLHARYEIHEWRHASAILLNDFPSEWADILDVLDRFVLHKSDIVTPGGSKSAISIWMDRELTAKGWEERKFETSIKVDDVEFASPTHKVDCFKNRIGLEIEWNNKDPFFDRDLNNFRPSLRTEDHCGGINRYPVATSCRKSSRNLGADQATAIPRRI